LREPTPTFQVKATSVLGKFSLEAYLAVVLLVIVHNTVETIVDDPFQQIIPVMQLGVICQVENKILYTTDNMTDKDREQHWAQQLVGRNS